MMESSTPQPMADPFAHDDHFRPSGADQRLLDSLPAELEDYFHRWVREPLGPELLRDEALRFDDWAAELRTVADGWSR